MFLDLRDPVEKDTVAVIEVTEKDLLAVVAIPAYSRLLLRQPLHVKDQCITDFDQVSQLPAWYGDRHVQALYAKKAAPTQMETVRALRDILKPIAQRYGLDLVED